MIRWIFLAGCRFALALNPAGEDLPVDPNVPPTIALVRRAVLSPSNDHLLVATEIFSKLPRLVEHRQEPGCAHDHLMWDLLFDGLISGHTSGTPNTLSSR